jgi:hypothetical protein
MLLLDVSILRGLATPEAAGGVGGITTGGGGGGGGGNGDGTPPVAGAAIGMSASGAEYGDGVSVADRSVCAAAFVEFPKKNTKPNNDGAEKRIFRLMFSPFVAIDGAPPSR